MFAPGVLEVEKCVKGRVVGPWLCILWCLGGIALVRLVHDFVLMFGLSDEFVGSGSFLPMVLFALQPSADGTATVLGGVP